MTFTTKKEDSNFIRSNQDNTLFKAIQIKDYKAMLSPDCVNFVDADGFAFKVASSVEEDYISVTEGNTGVTKEYSNISEWKGRGKKEGVISVDSVLGRENIKREAKGEVPYEISDFTVEKKKRLKFENKTTIIDGKRFNSSEEVMHHYLEEWVSAMKIQTQVPNVLMVIGKGQCHRNLLHLPKDYKSNRTGARPLLLKEARQYILDTYPSEEAPAGYETDEIVDGKAWDHYLKFRKTNVITGIKTSPDKDARNTAGFLFNPTKTFHFTYPQLWLIHAADKTVGEMELVKSGLKATGLQATAYQMTISDTSDFYGSRLTMPPEMKPDIKYGDAAFYKDFINLITPREVLQKVVDTFLMFYPKGVQFTSHLGKVIDEDTLWWCQQCFACQYMLRSLEDKTKFVDLLDRYKVDYSSLVDNNKEKVLPFVPEPSLREVVSSLRSKVRSLAEATTPKKAEKKDLQIAKLETIVEDLVALEKQFDEMFIAEESDK